MTGSLSGDYLTFIATEWFSYINAIYIPIKRLSKNLNIFSKITVIWVFFDY